jgi:hypothetical protein
MIALLPNRNSTTKLLPSLYQTACSLPHFLLLRQLSKDSHGTTWKHTEWWRVNSPPREGGVRGGGVAITAP